MSKRESERVRERERERERDRKTGRTSRPTDRQRDTEEIEKVHGLDSSEIVCPSKCSSIMTQRQWIVMQIVFSTPTERILHLPIIHTHTHTERVLHTRQL